MKPSFIGCFLVPIALGCTSLAASGTTGGSGTSGAQSSTTSSSAGSSSASSGGATSTGGTTTTTTTGSGTSSGSGTSTSGGTSGGCGPSCAPNVCCGETCTDLGSDRTNCGLCGALCPGTSQCFQGFCSDPATGTPALCNEIPCPAGYGCFIGRICLPTSCAASSEGINCDIPGFSERGLCCSEACVLPSTDPDHCGTCGNACGANQFCNRGQCADFNGCAGASPTAPCPLDRQHVGNCCGGACVDATIDSANCGACGSVCPTGATCHGAVCLDADGGFANCSAPGSCPTGTFCAGANCLPPDCTALADESACALGPQSFGTCCGGVCTDLTVDSANCLACGRACDPGDICTGGNECFPGAAPPGPCDDLHSFEPCTPDAGGQGICCTNPLVCTDIRSDPENCGTCTYHCASGQTCVAGICSGQGSACPSTRFAAYCDADAGPSFMCCPGAPCADLESDSANCGNCGHACGAGQSCTAGLCQ